MKKQRGFNLIELMIVVAILGILGSLGSAFYGDYVRTASRGEGTAMLLRVGELQERYYLSNNQYALTRDELGISDPHSANGNYRLTVRAPGGRQTWELIAEARGSQTSDTDCQTLTLSSNGQRKPVLCWE